MYSRVKFFKTSGCFLFQEGDRFYFSRLKRVINELKELELVSRKAKKEIVEDKLRTIRKGELGLDLRLVGTAVEKWVTLLNEDKCVVNEIGEKMVGGGLGGRIRIEATWSNPQNIYKEIINDIKAYISPQARILPGARIVGNSYVGRGCIIGNNALVRNSYIDNGAVVGYNTEVNASYIGRKTTLHTNFIGNSVIGDNCHFGYIACTTSLRLDGKNVVVKQGDREFDTETSKVGSFVEMNCSFGAYVLLMPGSFVGKGSIVRPYTLIKGFVPRNSYCRSALKTEISIGVKERNVKEQYSQLEKRLRVEINNNYGGRL